MDDLTARNAIKALQGMTTGVGMAEGLDQLKKIRAFVNDLDLDSVVEERQEKSAKDRMDRTLTNRSVKLG